MAFRAGMIGLIALLAAGIGSALAESVERSHEKPASSSDAARFSTFVQEFRAIATAKGIAQSTFDKAFSGISQDPEVHRLANDQPEFNTPIWDYLAKRVSDKRIADGREKNKLHASLLARLQQSFNVDRHILLAIWGMESNFGTFKGDMDVVRSLATLAYKGTRQHFAKKQLIAALAILQTGDIDRNAFLGSWAGAMGHTQFIPTTYRAHAVDWNGDGSRDVWNSVGDALASTGSYLARSGWTADRPWGWEITLPKGFDLGMIGQMHARAVFKWAKLGVKPARGGNFGSASASAWIIMPAGVDGPAFLVTQNFKAILAYNNSVAYALAVGHLADRIRGGQRFSKPWPSDQRPLARAERIELQHLLAQAGFYAGKQEGRFGRQTFAAVREYQSKAGLPADGYPNYSLLERLRSGR